MLCISCKQELADFRQLNCGHRMCASCLTTAVNPNGLIYCSQCKLYQPITAISNSPSSFADASNFPKLESIGDDKSNLTFSGSEANANLTDCCDACKKWMEDLRCLRCTHKFCVFCLSGRLGADGRLTCPLCGCISAVTDGLNSLPRYGSYTAAFKSFQSTPLNQEKSHTADKIRTAYSSENVDRKPESFDRVAMINECHYDKSRQYNDNSYYGSLNAENKLKPNQFLAVSSFSLRAPQFVNQAYPSFPPNMPLNHYAGSVLNRPYNVNNNCVPYFSNRYVHPYGSQPNFLQHPIMNPPPMTYAQFQVPPPSYSTTFYPVSQGQIEMNYNPGFAMSKAAAQQPEQPVPMTENFFPFTSMPKEEEYGNVTFSSYPHEDPTSHCLNNQLTNNPCPVETNYHHSAFVPQMPSSNGVTVFNAEVLPTVNSMDSQKSRIHEIYYYTTNDSNFISSKAGSDNGNGYSDDTLENFDSTILKEQNRDAHLLKKAEEKEINFSMNNETCPAMNNIQCVLYDNKQTDDKILQERRKIEKSSNENGTYSKVDAKTSSKARNTKISEKDLRKLDTNMNSLSLSENAMNNGVLKSADDIKNDYSANSSYRNDSTKLPKISSLSHTDDKKEMICNLYNYKSVVYFDEFTTDQNSVSSVENKFANPAFLHSIDNDLLLISDFNNDRVLFTNRCMRLHSCFSNFKTPKGLWCLPNKQLIVADSRRLSLIDLATGKTVKVQEKMSFNPWGLSSIDSRIAVCAPAYQKVFLFSPDLQQQVGEWDFSNQYTDYRLLPYTISQNRVATAGTNNAGALLYLSKDGIVEQIVQNTDEPFGNTLLDIDTDSRGTVIFSDPKNYRIVSRNENGDMCQSSDGGLVSPSGIALLSDNTLVVSDSYTNLIAFFI